MSHTYLESHGVRLDIEVQDESLMPAVEQILPPGWTVLEEFPEDGHFTVSSNGAGTYDVLAEETPLATGVPADVAIHVLDAQMRGRIAFLARDRIFIHAAVAGVNGRVVLMPAPSFSGKSALVAALVKAGATYYSDEFAVLDDHGRVHPYAKPLSLRGGEARYGDVHSVEALGGIAADGPAEAGMIVVTKYVPGGRWVPVRKEPGIGALALLANAVPARDRPQQATQAIARAAEGCIVLEGDRGDADETAKLLLEALEA